MSIFVWRRMALSAVLKVLKHGLVSADNPDAADAMHCIADAVTLCRFEATDPDHDDVVLSKILHVLLAGGGPNASVLILQQYTFFASCSSISSVEGPILDLNALHGVPFLVEHQLLAVAAVCVLCGVCVAITAVSRFTWRPRASSTASLNSSYPSFIPRRRYDKVRETT